MNECRALAIVLSCVFLFHTSGEGAFAQEPFAKCSAFIVDGPLLPPLLVHSPDGLYLALVPGEASRDEAVRIYHASGKDKYVLVRQVRLKSNEYPRFVLVSNDGQLVTLGEISDYTTHVEPDEVHIYSSNGKLRHVIDGDDVFTAEQLQISRDLYEGTWRCTPIKPWICWERPTLWEPEFALYAAEPTIRLLDTLGGFVHIELKSDKVTRQDDRVPSDMFDLYDSVANGNKATAGTSNQD